MEGDAWHIANDKYDASNIIEPSAMTRPFPCAPLKVIFNLAGKGFS